MKKVIIVFPSLKIKYDEGAKHRLNSFINEYSKAGYEVTTLAFVKGSFRGASDYLNKHSRWILVPQFLPFARNRILTSLLFFYMKMVLAILTWIKKTDIVQMEMFSIKAVCCYPKSKYYVDFHGDALYEYVETGRGALHDWFANYLKGLQKKSIVTTHKVICVSNNLKKQLEINAGAIIKDYSIISCGVDLDRFKNTNKQTIDSISDRVVVGYCGGLQKWQNIERILDIVIALRAIDESIYFCLYTNSDVSHIENKLENIGVENYLLKALKAEEVPSYLKILDAGFLIRDNLILNKVSSPTKISEYLAAGAGLICTEYSGDYEQFLTTCKDSVFVLNDFGESDIKSLDIWLRKRKNNVVPTTCLNNFTFEKQFSKAGLV